MRFAGLHVLGEMHGVPPEHLEPDALDRALRDAVDEGGGTVLQVVHHRFEPHGLTTLAVLAESHASVHTFPEGDALFYDIFTCGTADPERMADALVRALQPASHSRQLVRRGQAAT